MHLLSDRILISGLTGVTWLGGWEVGEVERDWELQPDIGRLGGGTEEEEQEQDEKEVVVVEKENEDKENKGAVEENGRREQK